MSIVIGIIVSSVSIIGTVGLVRFGISWSSKANIEIKRRREKKRIKKKLAISIESVNYNQFVNVIYEIKTYDTQYKRTQFVKSKKQYLFNNNHITSLNNFKMRFDSNYEEKRNVLKELIHQEIELSLSFINKPNKSW